MPEDLATPFPAGTSPTGPVEPSDHSLLRRFRGGDQHAATRLYSRYAHRVLALARKKYSPELASRVDVEDIVQSVFRVFFREARDGHYDVPAGEDLWKLLLVLALNKLRAERAFHRAAKRDVRHTTGAGSFEIEPPTAHRDDSASAFLEVALGDALERLSVQHRAVVEMRMEGYGVEEIALKTSRSKRTIERVLQEARHQLHELLPREEG